jgi:PAS domain S-box-containing protein
MKTPRDESEKSFEKMTRAELIEALRSLQSEHPVDELKNALHELEVHQVELEMQNRELRETHQLLEESRDRYADLYDFAPVGYITLSDKGRIEEINLTAAMMLEAERSALIGGYFQNYVKAEDRDRLIDHLRVCLRGKEKMTAEIELAPGEGDHLPVELSSVAVRKEAEPRIRTAIVDISERCRAEEALRRAEERLHQAQKMAAIGKLAGGAAHDFNNLLTVVIGYSALMLQTMKEDDPLVEWVLKIKVAGDRAAALTRQLLTFSGRQLIQYRALNLNDLLTDMKTILLRMLGEQIELVMNLDESAGSIKSDPEQIEQVVMNIVVNARDAMPDGGRLLIETAGIEVGRDGLTDRDEIRPGRYVKLEIKDTGGGMDKETLAHIFEPFFTTKEMGRGAGLGLSTVYGAVSQMDGHISVDSRPNAGTAFRIYLPESGEAAASVIGGRRSARKVGSETILLVEDDSMVRQIIAESLKEYGYTVIETANGQQAMTAARQHEGETIHLLLTDVILPQMSGPALADRLTPLHTEMKVLYISGYSDQVLDSHGLKSLEILFLPKPFTPNTLHLKIRQLLDQ